jgi:hypothetical protein
MPILYTCTPQTGQDRIPGPWAGEDDFSRVPVQLIPMRNAPGQVRSFMAARNIDALLEVVVFFVKSSFRRGLARRRMCELFRGRATYE